jgi:GT2 family glycosyltransferase
VSVSVIIPVFQDWRRLGLCLEALERQSLAAAEFEIIVANNEPNDDHPAVCLPANVQIIHEPRPGSYAARNAAAAIASGEYLAFTDSDCIPDPDWLRNGLAALKANPGARIAGPVSIFREEGSTYYAYLYDLHTAFPQREYVASGVSVTANLLVPRSVFERVGRFEERFTGGDIEWNRRAQAAGVPLVYGDDVLVRHPARRDLAAIFKKRRRAAGSSRFENSDFRFILERLKPPVRRFFRLRRQRVAWREALLVVSIHWLARVIQAQEFSLIRLGLRQPNRS